MILQGIHRPGHPRLRAIIALNPLPEQHPPSTNSHVRVLVQGCKLVFHSRGGTQGQLESTGLLSLSLPYPTAKHSHTLPGTRTTGIEVRSAKALPPLRNKGEP